MPPLLYIILLTAVLLVMLYWVLSATDTEKRGSRIIIPNQNKFSWESARELFRYLEAEEFYLAADSVKLLRTDSGHLRAYWRISPGKWQEILSQLGNKSGGRELVLRLHQADHIDSSLDTQVKRPVASYEWQVPAQAPCYASLGIKSKDSYTPLLFSDKLREGM